MRKNRHVIGAMITLLGFGLFFAGTVNAQSADLNPTLNDKWMFWMGGFFPDMDTKVRFDGPPGFPGDTIPLQDLLGFDDNKNVLWGGFRWRISRRNQLEVEISNLNNDGFVSATTDPIDIGDFTVQGTASISSEIRFALGRVTYGFSVLRKDKHDLALKAGVHIASAKIDIVATGDIVEVDTGMSVCPTPADCTVAVGTDEYTIPLPHLGISYDWAISPKWSLRTQALGFAIKINDIKGALTEIDLDLRFQPWKHFGFGAGYRFFNLNVKDEGEKSDLEFDYKYDGPVLYILGTF